ncbi:MAG: DNA gyrase inhibitor YacG [Tatlockia sp.]|nr:DNA gyrase inhibitor YacG [Tatlockia sp.]
MTNFEKINCPNCGKNKTWTTDNPFKPFCSERCKLIDLGDWASENHKIPGKTLNEEASESLEEDFDNPDLDT